LSSGLKPSVERVRCRSVKCDRHLVLLNSEPALIHPEPVCCRLITLRRGLDNAVSVILFMVKVFWFIGILVALLLPVQAESQILINELCPKNSSILHDEDGDDPDWFELYNAAAGEASLKDFSIIDGSGSRWFFPDTTLAPAQYLLVFASGKDRHTGQLHTSFRLSNEGELLRLLDPDGHTLDVIHSGPVQPDHSFGRSPLMITEWKYFLHPTPGSRNDDSTMFEGYMNAPVFSHTAGFYPGEIAVSIAFDFSSGNVFYTLDGSVPGPLSTPYTAPIRLDSTKVLRAKAFGIGTGFLPSACITATYFIGFNSTLPVFSISTNPGNLWDWNTGIYVKGPNASPEYPYFGANFWQDWEVPAHIEFFETNQKRVTSQDAGLSINGGSVSRTRPMQSLRLTARETYGESRFRYQLFQEKDISQFKNIVLRNSSGDYNKTHFRDGSLHKLMIGNVDVDLLCYRPSVVFLNGAYWGVQNIREKFSRFYLEENHAANPDRVDLLEEDSTIIQGDFNDFNAMYQYITREDMTQAIAYDSVARMLDIQSFCDYIIAETYLSNIDWPYNNIKYWKEKKPGSKWRYLLMDLDISLGNYGWAPAEMDVLGRLLGPYGDHNKHVQILRSLLQNEEFRLYFINRYADLVNTLFTAEHLGAHIDRVKEVLEPEMPRHFARWGNSMQTWNEEINQVVMPYIQTRPAYALDALQDVFDLERQSLLSLDCWPPSAGKIRINTVEPVLPWSGTYFKGVPVTLTLLPEPGYQFYGWISDSILVPDPTLATIQFDPSVFGHLTALFNAPEDKEQLSVFPNPAAGNTRVYFNSEEQTLGTLVITDISGRERYVDAGFAVNLGLNILEIPVHDLENGLFLLHVTTNKSSRSVKLLVIN